MHVPKTSVSHETSSNTHTSSLQKERFVRNFLKNSHFESAKRAFRARLPPNVARFEPAIRALRTRLLPKFMRQSFKTSISYETSPKVKSPKRALHMRLPPKVKREPPSEHTHQAALPSSFAIPPPPNNARPHANPNVKATFTSTQLATSRFPAPATQTCASTPPTRTKYCACHEI